MGISVQCVCGKQYNADEKLAGRRVRCPKCGNVFLLEAAPASGLSPEFSAPLPDPMLAMPAPMPMPTPPARGPEFAALRSRHRLFSLRYPFIHLDMGNNNHRLFGLILFVLFTLGALVCTVLLASSVISDHSFNNSARTIDGRLTGSAIYHPIDDNHKERPAYDLSYIFTVNGREWQGRARQCKLEDLPPGLDYSRPFEKQNATVKVYYDPQDPARNALTQRSVGGYLFLCGLALVFTVAGARSSLIIFRYWRHVRAIGG